MTVYALTPVPNIVTMGIRDNSGIFTSPLVAAVQTIDRGGDHWFASYVYNTLRDADRAEIMGLIAQLRGRAHRIEVPVYDNPKRGNYGGTPVVNGGSQTGNSLSVRGCSNSITNWIRRGDYFSVVVNGQHELKMATADANSGGTGLITLSFEPRLRFSPADGNAVIVEDGTLGKPRGVFMLADQEQAWSSRPGTSKIGAVALQMNEDVFATAP